MFPIKYSLQKNVRLTGKKATWEVEEGVEDVVAISVVFANEPARVVLLHVWPGNGRAAGENQASCI